MKTASFRLLLAGLLLLACALPMAAQDCSIVPMAHLDDLPYPLIHRTLRDADGYAWHATSNGLCRNNGYQIDAFRPARNSVITELEEDSCGRLICGTQQGLYVFDRKDFAFQEIHPEHFSDAYIFALSLRRNGHLWVGTMDSVFELDRDLKICSRHGVGKPVNSFYEDSHGQFWALLRYGGEDARSGRLLQYAEATHSFAQVDWPERQTCAPVAMLEEPRLGGYLVATSGEGIVLFRPETSGDGRLQWQSASQKSNRNGSGILSLLKDEQQGLIWTTTAEDLYLYKVGDGGLDSISTAALLPQRKKTLDLLSLDHAGNVWIGGFLPDVFIATFGQERVQRLAIDEFRPRTGFGLMGERVVKEDDSTYWIWQRQLGLTLYDRPAAKLTYLTDAPQGDLRYVEKTLQRCLQQPGIWASRGSQLLHLWRQGMAIEHEQLVDFQGEKIQLIREDQSKRLWIGTAKALYLYMQTSGEVKKLTDLDGGLLDLVLSKREAIAAVKGSGVLKVSDNGKTTRIAPAEMDITRLALAPNGTLWAATSQGEVLCLRQGESDWQRNETLSNENGSKTILALAADFQGHVWLLSPRSAIEYNPQNQAMRELKSDNQQIQMQYFYALEPQQDKRIGLAGAGAYCSVYPSAQLESSGASVRAWVSAVVTDGKRQLISPQTSEIDVLPSTSSLELYLTTLNYLQPDNVSFAFSLDGKQWTNLRKGNNCIVLHKLTKGNYHLQVRATDGNGNWGEAVECLTIHRLPAWWETWWARILFLLAAAAVVYGLYLLNQRIHYLQKLQRIRKEVSLNELSLSPKHVSEEEEDQAFLKRVVAEIEGHVSDPELNVSQLCSTLCMSRSNFYRKIVPLTGKSPNDLIREVRLKKAAKMIASNPRTPIVEVAQLVGFSSPSYFTKCFTKMFGVNPKKYSKENSEENGAENSANDVEK